MEAPPENFAYTLLLSPDFSKPDALAVIDVKPGSPTFSQIVHTVTMPYKGDEFHHFGWNACSSALSPLTGHAFLERRYLIIPGIRSSRIYIVDTKPDPANAKIHKIIEPDEVFKKTGYSRPHTVPLWSGRHLRQHARRWRQRWHRWATWRVHYGLRDVLSHLVPQLVELMTTPSPTG